MNTLIDIIIDARTAVIILCAVLLIVLALWIWIYLRRGRLKQARYGAPAQQTRPVMRFYEPPSPAEATRPSRPVHVPASITVIASSRAAAPDTQIRFNGEPDWPTLGDTQPLSPASRKLDDDTHPTRPRRKR